MNIVPMEVLPFSRRFDKIILSRKRVQHIFCNLVLVILISSISTGFTADDDSSSLTTYFDVHPSLQLQGEPVDITYIVVDGSDITSVQAIITYPDGTEKQRNMTEEAGIYQYSKSYILIGKYESYLIVENDTGSMKQTATKTFWITTDLNDTDDDGMPDWWEEQHGFNRFNPADAEEDTDDDGVTNYEEYETGSDPLEKPTVFENTLDRLTEEWQYLLGSFVLCMIIIVISLYGFSRRRVL